MKFWDSSALTPLLIEEADSSLRSSQLREDSEVLVWFATPVEIESAMNRRRREGTLPEEFERSARHRLSLLEAAWAQVEPTRVVRERALRLLRTHPLRAADALQLAAALVACGEQPRGFHFLTGDSRLGEAAGMEGFVVG